MCIRDRYHLDLASGGSWSRLSITDNSSEPLFARLTRDRFTGPDKRFTIEETSPGSGTYYINVNATVAGQNRLFLTSNDAGFTAPNTTGAAVTFSITPVGVEPLPAPTPQPTPTPQPVNVAPGGVASQSSTAFSGSASRAIDENTSGIWNQRSVTHTDPNDALPWWQVDLGTSRSIDNVVVWNRTNCCTDRLADFSVFVSDQPFDADATIAQLRADANVTAVNHPGTLAGVSVELDIDASGRYVRIQKPSGSALSLAEVQVFGSAE